MSRVESVGGISRGEPDRSPEPDHPLFSGVVNVVDKATKKVFESATEFYGDWQVRRGVLRTREGEELAFSYRTTEKGDKRVPVVFVANHNGDEVLYLLRERTLKEEEKYFSQGAPPHCLQRDKAIKADYRVSVRKPNFH